MGLFELHVEPHLVIRYVMAGHDAVSQLDNRQNTRPTAITSTGPEKGPRRGLATPVGLRPPYVANPRHSHLDCRALLILIDAL
ncbi:MAG: hypothetical protein L0H83_12240, partial [Salinisphaera sp.]|nr:hypothetical protein [Salinisphaera sp.]